MYQAVRRFGERAWDRNAREREAGMPRVVPPRVRPPDPLEDWSAYRDYLRHEGVRPDSPTAISATICAHGESP